MKKILTLFFALALVLGVNAAPRHSGLKPGVSPIVSFQPHERAAAVRPMAHKAPAAVQEDLDLYIPKALLKDATGGDGNGDTWFEVYGYSDDQAYYFILDVAADHLIDDFSSEIDFYYTFLVDVANRDTIDFVSGDVSVSMVADTLMVEGTLYDAAENAYNILMKQYTPGKEDIVNLTFEDADVDDTYFDWFDDVVLDAYTADAQYNIVLDWYPSEAIVGSYTEDDLWGNYSAMYIGDKGYRFSQAEFTVSKAAEGYVLEGDFLLSTQDWYHAVVPFVWGDTPVDPTGDTLDIVIPGWTMLKWYDEDQDFYVDALYGEIEVWFDFVPAVAKNPVGVYTNEDFLMDYTGVAVGTSEYFVTVANMTVVNDNDTIVMDAFFTASNGVVYHVVCKNYDIVPTDHVDVEFDEESIDAETYAEHGVVYFLGEGTDYVADLLLYCDGAGHYTEEDIAGLNGGSQGSGFIDMAAMSYIYIVSADIDVQVDAEGNYSMHCVLVCEDEVAYEFTIGDFATGVRNVERAAKAVKTIENGHLVIEREGKRFNAQGARL